MKFLNLLISINKDIKTKPTKYFWLVVFSLFALFLQAYMHNHNIVYIVLFFIFSVASSSCLIGRLNLYRIKLTSLNQEKAFANKKFIYKFKLENFSNSEVFDLHIRNRVVEQVASKNEIILNLDYMFSKRGKYKLEDIRVFSHFPFGHVDYYRDFSFKKEIIVFPSPKGKSLEKEFYRDLAFSGEKEEYDGLRNYQESDMLSDIHWASVAKGEKLSKKFTYSKEDKILHFYFQKAGSDIESKLSQLTLWSVEADKKGIDFVIHIPLKNIYSKKESLNEILTKLALY
jgi:hypothetical protein